MTRRTKKNPARLDYDIVNESDADRGNLYLMWFDAHAPLRLLVWADSFDDAFEYAVDYLDDQGKCGYFTFFDESDYKATAEDLGIEWPKQHGMFGLSERDMEKVRDATEVDHTIIGHTTLKCQKGQYSSAFVASDDWGGDDVHGDELNYVRAKSLTVATAERLRELGWTTKHAHGVWSAALDAPGHVEGFIYDQLATLTLKGGNGRKMYAEVGTGSGANASVLKRHECADVDDALDWIETVEDELKDAED
jgi:hypothetical protein